MANNELSGPAVLIYLSKWISKRKRKYSYRIIFTSETIRQLPIFIIIFKIKKECNWWLCYNLCR